MRRILLVPMIVAALAVAAASAQARSGSSATLSVGGARTSSFCTTRPLITVVHSCQGSGPILGTPGARSYCSWGETLLQGPRTYRLGQGNFNIQPGCYRHSIASASVGGAAVATSSVWFDP